MVAIPSWAKCGRCGARGAGSIRLLEDGGGYYLSCLICGHSMNLEKKEVER